LQKNKNQWKNFPHMDGFVVLDKPPHISSAAAVGRVKRLLVRGTKIGHAGTLDPFATGILLLLIGKGTKASEKLMNQPKQYDTTMKLGATTSTYDLESPEIPWLGAAEPSLENIKSAMAKFSGIILQTPPAFSALKIAGQPAYKLARSGKTIELKPREVRIDGMQILSWQWPLLKLRIDCGRGTYIRAIARDLGEMLNTGGYLTELRRTRIGAFDIADAVTLEQLQSDGVERYLRPISLADAEHSEQRGQNDQHQG
jgi:tRNA pseudouridine55 synthase